MSKKPYMIKHDSGSNSREAQWVNNYAADVFMSNPDGYDDKSDLRFMEEAIRKRYWLLVNWHKKGIDVSQLLV